MTKPIRKWTFKVELQGNGEEPEQAWAEASESFNQDPGVPDTVIEGEIVEDVFHLECDICGYKEDVHEGEVGEWMPEVYVGAHHLGMACPSCVEKYCYLNDEDMVGQVDIYSLDFVNANIHPLASKINAFLKVDNMSIFNEVMVENLRSVIEFVTSFKRPILDKEEIHSLEMLERAITLSLEGRKKDDKS